MGISEKNKEVKHGKVKMAYFRCPCGAINYMPDVLVRPDKKFKIELNNNREISNDVFIIFTCHGCRKNIEFGITPNFVDPLKDN